ncbi:GNAT family N-acetyltransferase [Mechercharimyces sp. CAU 1602]|uniref:GNAT family N-acetyltransferase n=1 Tax=Mechercharimyces sp. CAU 1602 TaxID=2973933 RepID=UPI002161ABAE|nr:GNAT family N-acetyltransferase [Mechercharimyces sp. CAU 1602]MCS1352312.1 hypothetical protein [Mechercharimyces sp. CAU 1602]
MFLIRRAEERDITPICQLLCQAGLHEEGVDKHIDHFLVIEREEDEQILGAVGIEVYGDEGLLRSFVIESEVWNGKVGLELFGAALSFAQYLRLTKVYLFAGVTKRFFEEAGFTQVPWEVLPVELKKSDHIHHAREKGGVLMVTSLSQVKQSQV